MEPHMHPLTRPSKLSEIVDLVDAIPFYGPPIVFFALPWVLFALLLLGPFAVLITVVLALLAVRLLILALVALARSSYRFARHLHSTPTRETTPHAIEQSRPAPVPLATLRHAR